MFIGSSLGGQVSQGCPKPDRPGRNRPPVAGYCAIAPAFQNKLLEMQSCLAFRPIVLMLLLRNPFLEAKTVGTG